jgi:protein subunit release factor A
MTTAEKRELAGMADKIEQAEAKIKSLHTEMEKPQVASNYAKLNEISKSVEAAQKELSVLFERWEELEAKATVSA